MYLKHRSHYRKQDKRLATSSFIQYVEKHFKNGWSLDACVRRAKIEGLYPRDQMVCTKTLYNYVDAGLLGIKNYSHYKTHCGRKRDVKHTKKLRTRQLRRVLFVYSAFIFQQFQLLFQLSVLSAWLLMPFSVPFPVYEFHRESTVFHRSTIRGLFRTGCP